MDIVIVGIIAIAAGAAIGLLIARSRNNEGANSTEQTARLTEEKTKLVAQAEVLLAEKKNSQQPYRRTEKATSRGNGNTAEECRHVAVARARTAC